MVGCRGDHPRHGRERNGGPDFRALAPRFQAPLDLVDRADGDVTRIDDLRRRLDRQAYSAIVNLAAATDVDRCEREPEWAEAINAQGAENLATVASERGLVLVHFSTTAIFGGDDRPGPFCEHDVPNPPNVYAETKRQGELRAHAILGEGLSIVRTAWVMGGGPRDKKFIGQVAARLIRGEPVRAVCDQYGSPTYAHDLVECVAQLLARGARGVFHVTNRGRATRYDMAQEMRRILGSTSVIEAVAAASFELPARRSRDDSSISVELPKLGITLPSWQDALRRAVETTPHPAAP